MPANDEPSAQPHTGLVDPAAVPHCSRPPNGPVRSVVREATFASFNNFRSAASGL